VINYTQMYIHTYVCMYLLLNCSHPRVAQILGSWFVPWKNVARSKSDGEELNKPHTPLTPESVTDDPMLGINGSRESGAGRSVGRSVDGADLREGPGYLMSHATGKPRRASYCWMETFQSTSSSGMASAQKKRRDMPFCFWGELLY